MILTKHQNSEGFAKGLLPFFLAARPSASCFPWNPWNAPETEWLLTPVKGNPAYRPSKYFTEMDRADEPADSRLHAGIYVEKGYDGDARKVFPRNQLMDATWGWHHVLDGVRSGTIPSVLSGMPPACQAQTVINLYGGYDGAEYGNYLITLTDSNGGALLTSVDQPCKEMAPLATVQSWPDLAAALDRMTKDGWLWMNFYIYLQLGLAPREGAPVGEIWSDQHVWSRFLEPLLPWISEK